MIRSAVILGVISFIYMLVANVAMVLCAPFLALILGILAGVLAGIIDKPQTVNKSITSGALAGGLAGIGAVIGNSAGLLIRTFVVFTPQTLTDMLTEMTGVSYTAAEANGYSLIPVCCCAVTDLILMAAAGALGGFLWYRYHAKKQSAITPPLGSS
jgi:hypothetical protein